MKKKLILLPVLITIAALSAEISAQVYTGGNIGLHIDDRSTYADIAPVLGYRQGIFDFGISPFFSYRDYHELAERYSYGNRIFTQITFIPGVFAHGELEVTNIETSAGDRKWITGLPLGGGYRYSITHRTRAYGMVLYDVLLDDESPVRNPIFRAGVVYDF